LLFGAGHQAPIQLAGEYIGEQQIGKCRFLARRRPGEGAALIAPANFDAPNRSIRHWYEGAATHRRELPLCSYFS
jgi:hypothetical protein